MSISERLSKEIAKFEKREKLYDLLNFGNDYAIILNLDEQDLIRLLAEDNSMVILHQFGDPGIHSEPYHTFQGHRIYVSRTNAPQVAIIDKWSGAIIRASYIKLK